jgi:hypothetical protein
MAYIKNCSGFRVVISCFVLVLCIGINDSSAQTSSTEKIWHFFIEPYMLFPYMSGETGIRNLPSVTVDANAGDILSKLQFGAMLYMEASTIKWTITSDLLYSNLKQDVTPGAIINSGNASAKLIIWEAAGLYRITSFLDFGVGSRLDNVQSGIDVLRNTIPGNTEAISAGLSKTWFDPILIMRVTGDLKKRWLFQFRGDLGGFGIGSDFTWQIQGYAGYQFSKLFRLTTGYKVIGINYDKGTGEDHFLYNVKTFGPVIKLGFTL